MEESMSIDRSVSRRVEILSPDQCEQIHRASLQILERTGVRLMDPAAASLLESAGAALDGRGVTHIPPALVERALRDTPARVVIHDRQARPALELVPGAVHFGTGSDCHWLLDPRTGERRRFTKTDVEDGIRLCDALPNIDFVLSIGLISDRPTGSSDVHQFDAMIRNTTKPIVFTTHDLENCRTIVEMAAQASGSGEQLHEAPSVVHFAEVDCPLKYAADTCRKISFVAGHGIPVLQGAGPMMGASGPQTHAGALALANAECLTGNALVQLVRPGAPFIRGLGIHPFDMRSGTLPYGAPELSLNNAAAADLARFYGQPTWGYAGCSDAKTVDQQAAVEATASILMSLLGGANLVHDVGYIESGMTSAFEMIVLSDTIIEMGRAMLKEIEITPETLALDVIDRVSQEGSYLDEDHTLAHFREVWYPGPGLIDRERFPAWEAAGRTSAGDRLNRRVLEILETHRPAALPDGATERLAHLVAEADRRAPN
jgi:trimethylamine--corrinoid protein Co-methyltransferase